MIYGRGALEGAARTARVDGEGVVLRPDGGVVAVNRFSAYVAGPPPAEALARVPLDSRTLPAPVSLDDGAVQGVVRLLPRDKRFGGLLEHADVSPAAGTDAARVSVETTDGVRRTRQEIGARAGVGAGDAVVLRALGDGTGMVGRLVLNRKRLIAALEALDAACTDTTGESPVWVEVLADGVRLRGVDYRTGARTTVLCTAYGGPTGEWLERDAWEMRQGAVRRVGGAVRKR